ncbi:MAG: hypothetical protein NTW86_10785, partial [Candidatus Sumerlaeota bacterium]|nr:hypothetical protein [Candidatus Sumerlaeota bacterium]
MRVVSVLTMAAWAMVSLSPLRAADGATGAAKDAPVVVSIQTTEKTPLRMLFGFNEYVISSTPYHPFDDPMFVNVMKDSGASIMRFPGGSIANFYDWKNDDFMTSTIQKVSPAQGVPRDRFSSEAEYKAMVDKYEKYLGEYITKGTKCVEIRKRYGYADFLDMTRQIGADIFYVGNVSMAPGGADPGDYLVAWMERLKAEGAPVKYLELGNEVVSAEGIGNVQAIPNGLYDLDRYMKVCETVSRKVKAIFPSVKIGIVTHGFVNLGSNNSAAIELSRRISDKYPKDFYDAVISHSYLRTPDRNPDPVEVRREKLYAMSRLMVERSVDHWKTAFPGKEIWMTETGYVPAKNTPADEKNLTTCLFTALLEADYFLRWVENDDVARAYVKYFSTSTAPSPKSCRFWDNEAHTIIPTPVHYTYSLIGGAVKNSSQKLKVEVTNAGGHILKYKAWTEEPKGARDEETPGQGGTENVDILIEDVTARAFLSKDGKTIYAP